MHSNDKEGLTPTSIDSHIAKIQAVLELAKADLKMGADSLSLARKIQVLKVLIDELAVMEQIREGSNIGSSADNDTRGGLP